MPAYWHEALASDDRSVLEEETCVIQGQHYFVRARLVIPVLDAEENFEWGVWVSLSPDSFRRMTDMWTTPGREQEPAYFGWLSTELHIYSPATVNLKTRVQTEPVGTRPHVILEPTDHPWPWSSAPASPSSGCKRSPSRSSTRLLDPPTRSRCGTAARRLGSTPTS